ncbi:MAG: DMT family transporter [Chloroflexi bacterium]|nr:DMT family transporter [Chloroflexota bacterium]
MKPAILAGALAALVTGIIITAQAALLARSGGTLGAARTGLFTYLLGGAAAAAILAILTLRPDRPVAPTPGQILVVAVAGLMGVAILTGIAFSGQRVGVGAALGAMLLGQMAAAILVDAFGWGGAAIPVTLPRLAGLAALAAGVWLLLPRG